MVTEQHIREKTDNLRRCPRCDAAWLHERVPRPWWVKTFFFFLPLKRYKCYRCNRKSYLWEKKEDSK